MEQFSKLAHLFKCIECGQALLFVEHSFKCMACHQEFPVVNGIPRFVPPSFYSQDDLQSNLEEKTKNYFGFEWDYFKDWGFIPDESVDVSTRSKYFGGFVSSRQAAFDIKCRLSSEDLKEGNIVLDAGCGNGRYTYEAASRGKAIVIGVDIGYGSVTSAYSNNKVLDNVLIIQANLLNLPFRDNVFNACFSNGVLHHTSNAELAFYEVARTVAINGIFVAHVYQKKNRLWELNDKKMREFTTSLSIDDNLKFASLLSDLGLFLNKFPRIIDNANKHLCLLPTLHHMFDWYSAPIATHHTYVELANWFQFSGFNVTDQMPEKPHLPTGEWACNLKGVKIAPIKAGLNTFSLPKKIKNLRVFLGADPGGPQLGYIMPFPKMIHKFLTDNGVHVTLSPDEAVDVALCIAFATSYPEILNLKKRGAKIVHRLDGRVKSIVKVYDKDEEVRKINSIADVTVFQSEYVKQHTTQDWRTIFGLEMPICNNADNGVIIYNGVDRSIFNEAGDRYVLPGEIRILHVAITAGVRKGASYVLKIAKLLENNPAFQFYLIGNQHNDLSCGHIIKDKMRKNVTHLGPILDQPELAKYMRSCNILLFPSQDDYCPNTVIEAMSCGLPVWYHNSGGTPELVRCGELIGGVPVVPENDILPLYTLIENIDMFSKNAVEIIKTRFTSDIIGKQYLDMFNALIRS